jgi:hypothetical protein
MTARAARKLPTHAAPPAALRTIAKRAKAAAVANLAVVDAVERTLEDAEDAAAVDDARARRARGEKTIPAAEARRRLGF